MQFGESSGVTRLNRRCALLLDEIILDHRLLTKPSDCESGKLTFMRCLSLICDGNM